MSKYSTFLQYLKTREGGFSLLLVIICGFGLSFFIGLTFVDRLPALYHLDFGKAQWIEAATPSVTNYFRKTIYLGGPVDRAWIQISATDRYDLFVNNTLVETHLFDRTCVTGLYDLRGKLQLGKNVIAVAVARDSYPGSAQIIVRGFYRIVGSPVQEFCSGPGDDSWRASNTPDGIVGGWRWSNPHLDDSFWSLPKVAPEKDRFRIQPVNFDPRLLESQPTGKWIAQPPGSGNQASFAYNFRIPANRRETWLELAATGNYD
ncbi:MAG: hypothetical protein JO170_22045, partial [Verrucomicrobia bacterium]|nr:hypothetical protein [Verrucomicrobiota bacterium]